MKQQCIDAITRAIGRKPLADEIRNIEQGINDAVRTIRVKNAQSGTVMPDSQVYAEAAKLAGQRAVHSIYKKRQRIAQDAIARANLINELKNQVPESELTPEYLAQAIFMGRTRSSKNLDIVSAEEISLGALQDWTRQLSGSLEKAGPEVKAFFDAMTNSQRGNLSEALQLMLLKEIRGEDTGSVAAKKFAEVWRKSADQAKRELNDNGADIATRDDWGLPNYDSRELISRAGRNEWLATLPAGERATATLLRRQAPIEWARDRWVSDTIKSVDRNAFLDDRGMPLDDAALRDVLNDVFTTKSTDGANKIEPGAQGGSGGIKNRGANSHRVLVFKDAESQFAYMQKYSDKSIAEVMMDHLQYSARQLGILKTFGPSAENNFRYILDSVYKGAMEKGHSKDAMDKQRETATAMFNYQAGLGQNSSSFVPVMQRIRNLMTSAMLGSSVINAGFTDQFIMRAMSSALKLDNAGAGINSLKNLISKDRKQAIEQLGLMSDIHASVTSRLGGNDVGRDVTGWFAEKTLKWSGLIALDKANKASFGMNMLYTIGNLTRKFDSLQALKASDYDLLSAKGWTERDWQIMRAADLGNITEKHLGMTPDSIYAVPDAKIAEILKPEIEALQKSSDDAVAAMGKLTPEREKKIRQAYAEEVGANTARMIRNARAESVYKLLGITHSEMMQAITSATNINRFKAATEGEFYRSAMLFKTTPFAGVANMVRRVQDLNGMNKATFLARYIAGTWIGGAMAIQVNHLISGEDPDDMTKGSFWLRALVKGGSFGIYGDFMLADQTKYGSSIAATLGGPALGLGEGLFKLAVQNTQKLAKGEDTTYAADAIRVGKMVTPFANLWYTKAVFNHLILQQAQEMASPGYNAKLRQNMERNYDTKYWWKPGATDPRRGPDFERAVGK